MGEPLVIFGGNGEDLQRWISLQQLLRAFLQHRAADIQRHIAQRGAAVHAGELRTAPARRAIGAEAAAHRSLTVTTAGSGTSAARRSSFAASGSQRPKLA